MKDNVEDQFGFVHHNVSSDHVNEMKMEYAKLGKVDLKNRVCLLHSDISQRAHQWTRVHVKKYLGVSLPMTLVSCVKVAKFTRILCGSFS